MRQRLALSLIVLAATLPFLGKAFHIDDPLYLAVARQILQKPWDPFGAEVLWESEPESLFDADFNPPLWSYCVAAVLAVTGEPEVTVEQIAAPAPGTADDRGHASRRPEIALHLLESVFVAAAIVAMYLLARRWVRWPLTATALVALSPAMLPGQNIMLEGPVMALWLWCVWCHLRAIETNELRWAWASGALAALAVLTKYTSGLVIVVLVLHSIRRRHWRSLWFLAPPLAALAAWTIHNWIVYERAHVLVILGRVQTGERHPVGISVGECWSRLMGITRTIGAVTALALPIGGIIARRWGTRRLLALMLIAAALGWVGKSNMSNRLDALGTQLEDVPRAEALEEWQAKQRHMLTNAGGAIVWGVYTLRESVAIHAACIHAIAFGGLGAFVLLGLGLATWPAPARRDATVRDAELAPRPDAVELPARRLDEEALLWHWIGLVFAFNIVAVPYLAVRHLLPGVPPLVWLVLRRLDESSASETRAARRWLLRSCLLVTAACGMLVAKADYDFAEWYRHMAVDVGSRSVAAGRLEGKDVWFTGHWGWPYYADRAGMRPFSPKRSHMRAGDFLLMPMLHTWQAMPEELNPYLKGRMEPIKPRPRLFVPTSLTWINQSQDWCLNSVRSISTGVNLYGHGVYDLPWRFSRKPLDDFVVIEVTGEARRSGS